MSQIVIFLGSGLSADALMSLQRVTGRSLTELRAAVEGGRPIFSQEIFDSQYEEHAKALRYISGIIGIFSLSHRIHEVPEGTDVKSYPYMDRCRITREILGNILDERDGLV